MSKGLIKTGDSSMDKIRAFYIDPVKYPLSDTLEAIRQRLTVAWNLTMNYWSNQKIVNKWEIDYGLSQAQAYIDIRNARHLFGEINKMDRQAKQNILFQYSYQMLIRARQNADPKAEGKAIDLMGKYSGLKEDEIMEFNIEKFENKDISISLPKKMQEMLLKHLESGSVDFNSIDVTEIEFEELKKEKEDGSEEY